MHHAFRSYFSGMSCPTRSSLSRLALTSGRPSSPNPFPLQAVSPDSSTCLKLSSSSNSPQSNVYALIVLNDDAQDARFDLVGYLYLDSFPRDHSTATRVTLTSAARLSRPKARTTQLGSNSSSLNNLVAGYLDRKPSSVVCHICNDQMLHEAIKTERTHVLAESPLSEKLRSEERCENALLEPRFILFPTNL